MFEGSKLTSAPELPAETLADSCYYSMFAFCTDLNKVPALPADTLAPNCYHRMFNGCTGLRAMPALPATTLGKECYREMFQGCTNLTEAPDLPATTLTEICYLGMFQDCTGLTTAPALPATTLTESCYYAMFQNCTSLTTAPELPATTLAESCYTYMFADCTDLNYIKVHFTSWADDHSAPTIGWVWNVSDTGTFVCPEGLDVSEEDPSHVPEGWTVERISGINSPVMDNRFDPNGVIHNVSGQRVDENYKGILIQNGKKYLRRH